MVSFPRALPSSKEGDRGRKAEEEREEREEKGKEEDFYPQFCSEFCALFEWAVCSLRITLEVTSYASAVMRACFGRPTLACSSEKADFRARV